MPGRLFRLLLRVLPAELRDGYARDMEVTFSAELASARGSGRARALLLLWLATVGDVLRAAPGEHLEILGRDLRVALRGLAARPAHTITAVVTLALGLGANVVMFAVADAVLLSPLPYRDADELVAVQETARGEASNLGYLSFLDLKTRARTVRSLAAATQSTATFAGDGRDAERVNAMRVSREYFDLVGVQPILGRAFTVAEDQPGNARRVVVLSDALWRRRFGGNPAVVGQPVTISDVTYVVVGVMPPGFDDLVANRFYRQAALWFPLGYDPAASFACRTCRHLRVFGRLAPGVSVAAAQQELSTLMGEMEREHARDYTGAGARVTTLEDLFLGPVRPALLLLWGGVALLLLVACANVASLLLLRASERAAEVSVRAALGVTRGRLVRQLLTESALLSGVSAVAALIPAWAVVRMIAVAGPEELPRLATAALDARAVAAAIALATVSGLLFGLVPLRQLLRRDDATSLHGAGRRSAGGATWRARSALVAVTVAMATVLLAGSGVLVRSVTRLLAVEPGFNPHGVLTLRLWAGGARFSEGETPQQVATAVRYYDDVLTRVRALPGVTAAAAVTTLPMGGGVDGFGLHVEGRFTANPEDAPAADRFVVTPEYFATLRIPLVRGRVLDARDTQSAKRVAVINRTAAAMLFSGEDPLGHRVVLGGQAGDRRTIVGIVGDVRHHGLDREVAPQVYVPQAQWAWSETLMTLVVRTSGDPGALAASARRAVREVDPAQPVTDVQVYDAVVATTTSTRRFVAGALGVFAATALVLAIVGLYGALSVTVAQRRMEIGIRLALGARAEAIRRMVFLNGLRPVVLGLAAGVAAAMFALRAMGELVFHVQPLDPASLAGAVIALLLTGAAACLVPAWRAARIDPALALRAE